MQVAGVEAFITTQISECRLYYTYLDDIGAANSIVVMFDDADNVISQSRAIDEKNLAALIFQSSYPPKMRPPLPSITKLSSTRLTTTLTR